MAATAAAALAAMLGVPASFACSSLALAGISAEVLVAFGLNPADFVPKGFTPSVWTLLGLVVPAPVVETLLLALGLKVLLACSRSYVLVAAASAVIWGALHALYGVLSFFGTVWAFFVFSCAYLAWRRASFVKGFLAAAVPHALSNLITFVALVVRSL